LVKSVYWLIQLMGKVCLLVDSING